MAFRKAALAALALAATVAHARLQASLQADGTADTKGGSADEAGASILAPPPAEVNQHLTICNAYSSTEPMTVLQQKAKAASAVLTQAWLHELPATGLADERWDRARI